MTDTTPENVEKSDQLKRSGNGAMGRHEYREAIAAYTAAIPLNPHNHLLFSNRAQAYLALAPLTDKHTPDETSEHFYRLQMPSSHTLFHFSHFPTPTRTGM